ncbi:hypothetical protein AB3R30_20050 [Leptolyngbyaceae cyanobacterium UHCC 1019]
MTAAEIKDFQQFLDGLDYGAMTNSQAIAILDELWSHPETTRANLHEDIYEQTQTRIMCHPWQRI